MQKDDGSFNSTFMPAEGGLDTTWSSLYYPGEAALCLLMLNEIDLNDEWLQTAAKALSFLAETRRDQENVPADHWALLATRQILKKEKCDRYISRDVLQSHSAQICKSMLESQVKSHKNSSFIGGFSHDGRITPTSTCMEGLFAALDILPQDHHLYPQIKKAVRKGITFLLRYQVKSGKYSGGFTGAVSKKNRIEFGSCF